ncbi:MAG: hypothetical protein ACK4M9_03925 [Anaerobacillus sp.]|uniref:hypothetical protein n=1 Tax=Anaerobacillus sp. TaxID=1872506 RepID=UPI00391B4841
MILLNGVSGFNSPDDKLVDGNQFKSLCFTTVLSLGGSLLSFKEPEGAQNYYQTDITILGDNIFILLNGKYPFIAFASSVLPGDITFIDHHQLSFGFKHHYRILSANELNEALRIRQEKGKIVIDKENELNAAELVNIKYWKPKRVGDIVFNHWD